MGKRKKVFVTGCFDMLHSGHVAFLMEAASHGDVYVGIGSDETVHRLKGRFPVNNQDERRFMLEALRCITRCTVNTGSGILDFVDNPDALDADMLFVNEDGSSPEKEDFCRKHGLEYVVSKRLPHGNLPIRTTTALRTECNIPFRIDLAGGWLDQPFVSKHYPGSVLTISIEPTIEFNDRSGMASSTRRRAIELWHTEIPSGDKEKLAKTLFSYDNPPGTEIVSGSQDALGIVLPGLNKLDYRGEYWPYKIHSTLEESILRFVEDHFFLVTLEPRMSTFSVLDGTRIDAAGAKRLADAADECWKAVMSKNLEAFGVAFTQSFDAQTVMFPNMVDDGIRNIIERYRSRALGWKLSGAGGGGYLILVSDREIENTIRIKVRRSVLVNG
ncbi:MAG: adenylyltransferase/cytidyltransferase family protein [Ignavibacteriales bacterium]|nr:adenylyltransferase/cytidyltransferase family protein [Ignavibacteriales bacterium]